MEYNQKNLNEGYQPKSSLINKGLQPKAGNIGKPPQGGSSVKKPK